MTKRLIIGLSVLFCLVYLCVPRVTHVGTNAQTTFERVARQLESEDESQTVDPVDVLIDGC